MVPRRKADRIPTAYPPLPETRDKMRLSLVRSHRRARPEYRPPPPFVTNFAKKCVRRAYGPERERRRESMPLPPRPKEAGERHGAGLFGCASDKPALRGLLGGVSRKPQSWLRPLDPKHGHGQPAGGGQLRLDAVGQGE